MELHNSFYLKTSFEPLHFQSPRSGMSLIFRAPFEMATSRYVGFFPRESLENKIQRKIQQQVAAKLAVFDPQFIKIAREVEAITCDDKLSTEDKQKKINEVRARYGVSKEDMKAHVTEPLEKIYAQAHESLAQELNTLKKDQERIETLYGKNSPQALQSARVLAQVQSQLEPLQKKLQLSQETYHGMYQKGGCVKKLASGIGGIVKGVANTFTNFAKGLVNPQNWFKPSFWLNAVAPLAVSLIPGVGLVAAVGLKWARLAYAAYNTVKSLAQKNWQAALGGVMGLFAKAGVKISIPLISKINTTIQKVNEKMNGWREKWTV